MPLTFNFAIQALECFSDGETSTDEELVPVSYTHLDVYKRQPISRQGF